MTDNTRIVVNGRNVPLDFDGMDPVQVTVNLDHANWRDCAVDVVSGDLTEVYAFDIPHGTLYVDTDQSMPVWAVVRPGRPDLPGHLLLQEFDVDSALWLAEHGVDPIGIVLREATADDDPPFRVWRQPHFYHGTYGAPRPDFACDDDADAYEFASFADAVEYVKRYYTEPSGYDGVPACNVLSHGQAGPDTLTIVTPIGAGW